LTGIDAFTIEFLKIVSMRISIAYLLFLLSACTNFHSTGRNDSCLANKIAYSEANLPLIYGREAINANDMYRRMNVAETKWIYTVKTPKAIKGNLHFSFISSLPDKYSNSNRAYSGLQDVNKN
jgi:hypothetical protein